MMQTKITALLRYELIDWIEC